MSGDVTLEQALCGWVDRELAREEARKASLPRLLEVCCCAGGASYGFRRAGFMPEGVDIKPQPNYPFRFHLADGLDFIAEHGHEYDAISAHPPCQDYSPTAALHTNKYPRLIGAMREALIKTGVPYIIENVEGARSELRNPIKLCGSSFGLGVRRHRLFETSWPILFAPQCAHHLQPEPVDVTGTGGRRLDPRSGTRHPGGGDSRKPLNLAHAREVMGIDWMKRPELSEAVPPAYTEWLGHELMAHLSEVAA
jgi:DNA (cytosine-5)-methyltransferase 1